MPRYSFFSHCIARPPFWSPFAHVSPTKCFFNLLSASNTPTPSVTVPTATADPTSPVNLLSITGFRDGAFLEYCYVGALPFSGTNQKPMSAYAENMKAVGPAHVIMSSDLGNAVSPVPTAGMRSYIQALLKEGMTPDEIDIMARRNPAFLLALK
jgi:hypothetical protein